MTELTQEQTDAAEKEIRDRLISVYVAQLPEETKEMLGGRNKKSISRTMESQSYFANDGPALFMEGPKVNALKFGGTVIGKREKIFHQPVERTERVSKRIVRVRYNGNPKNLKGTTKPAS